MKKFYILTMLVTCVFTHVVGAEETLVACGNPEYPPFTYQKGDKIEGVAPDVLKLIFEELGISIDSRGIGNWKRCQYTVEKGRADILMAGYMTEEREAYAAYPETPLASDPQSIFVWKGREFPFERWDDLKGKTAGLLLGFSTGPEFDSFLEQNTQVDRVSRRIQNYKKLELSRIDFLPDGLYSGLMTIKDSGYEGKVIPLPNPINAEYCYLAISRQSKFLKYMPQLEKGLKALQADGTIDRLIAHHLEQYGIQYQASR